MGGVSDADYVARDRQFPRDLRHPVPVNNARLSIAASHVNKSRTLNADLRGNDHRKSQAMRLADRFTRQLTQSGEFCEKLLAS